MKPGKKVLRERSETARGRARDLVTHYEPKSQAAEAFRALRTNLQFLRLQSKGKLFLITSSFVQEGKTLNVVNLALSMAQAGNKVLMVDADLRKPNVHRVFGLSREPGVTDYVLGNYHWREIIGNISDIMLGEFEIEDILKTPGMDNLHCVLRQADGTTVGLVVIFQDLTERKRAEEQLRRADRLAALGQLAANIAHEVRNPLAAISGAVEVLREDLTATGSNRQLLDLLLGEAHRPNLITGQFLDFAKPQSLLFRPCGVRPLIEETLRLLDRSRERHPITACRVFEHVPDAQVLADADQFRQVVWNLCLNAIQAMPGGGALTVSVSGGAPPLPGQTVTASTGPPGQHRATGATRVLPTPLLEPSTASADGKKWVEIAFHDTGNGIAPGELQRIFDPFFTTRPSGTGLGLAIARKILESMGGHVAVESSIGSGTTFRVWLSRRAAVGAGTAWPR